MPILALMEIKLKNILIWSPQPLKSILSRIPLGAHFLLISTKSKRVFNDMREKEMLTTMYHFNTIFICLSLTGLL